ncbi:hypothetical protein [Streptomyces sp. NPDC052114]|uniref:hypothetical protein n=1 Tax=unclassified Streptomyces TaxID=2593676 RepID=UPI00341C9F08
MIAAVIIALIAEVVAEAERPGTVVPFDSVRRRTRLPSTSRHIGAPVHRYIGIPVPDLRLFAQPDLRTAPASTLPADGGIP